MLRAEPRPADAARASLTSTRPASWRMTAACAPRRRGPNHHRARREGDERRLSLGALRRLLKVEPLDTSAPGADSPMQSRAAAATFLPDTVKRPGFGSWMIGFAAICGLPAQPVRPVRRRSTPPVRRDRSRRFATRRTRPSGRPATRRFPTARGRRSRDSSISRSTRISRARLLTEIPANPPVIIQMQMSHRTRRSGCARSAGSASRSPRRRSR